MGLQYLRAENHPNLGINLSEPDTGRRPNSILLYFSLARKFLASCFLHPLLVVKILIEDPCVEFPWSQ